MRSRARGGGWAATITTTVIIIYNTSIIKYMIVSYRVNAMSFASPGDDSRSRYLFVLRFRLFFGPKSVAVPEIGMRFAVPVQVFVFAGPDVSDFPASSTRPAKIGFRQLNSHGALSRASDANRVRTLVALRRPPWPRTAWLVDSDLRSPPPVHD